MANSFDPTENTYISVDHLSVTPGAPPAGLAPVSMNDNGHVKKPDHRAGQRDWAAYGSDQHVTLVMGQTRQV